MKKAFDLMYISTLAMLLVFFFAMLVHAGTGTDGLSFLKIKPSARGASLGDAYVAIADDANASFYNPAGLTGMEDVEISLMHMMYMAETSYDYGSIGMPVNEQLKIGLHVIYLNYGAIPKITENISDGTLGLESGSFNPSDIGIGLSAGYKINESLSVGLTAKYAVESIDAFSLTGIMADVGILANVEGIRIGLAGYNIGSAGAEKAPLTGRMGVSTKFKVQNEDDLVVGAGASYVAAGAKLSGSLGAEYTYDNLLVLRGSYSSGTDLDTVNIGAGLKGEFAGIQGNLDYNFSLLGDVGQAHRISLGAKFGSEPKSKVKSQNSKIKSDYRNINIQQKKQNTLKYYFKR